MSEIVPAPAWSPRRLDAQVRWFRRWANLLWLARHDGSDFSIISNNCWGGAIYRSLRRPYLSPFAGTFLMAPCYLRMLADLPAHLRNPLRPAADSRYESIRLTRGRVLPAYPIGILGDDVEVHFLHYATWAEAAEKWARRTARLRWDRLFVKFSEQNESTLDGVNQFLALPFERKICLTNRTGLSGQHVVCLGGAGPTTRGQEDLEYRRYFDVPAWLCGGQTRGGAALRRWSRRADAWAALASVRRRTAGLAHGEEPELNLDEQVARLRALAGGSGCRT